jgi:hypothetical protein
LRQSAHFNQPDRPTCVLAHRLDRSDADDVGGEEVDAVAVEVAVDAVVMLGGTGVGVSGEDLRVSEFCECFPSRSSSSLTRADNWSITRSRSTNAASRSASITSSSSTLGTSGTDDISST